MAYTCKDIAKKAGVSISTVSRVLNSKDLHKVGAKTQKKVGEVIDRLGYTPNIIAKSLVSRKSFSVAVALEDFGDIIGPYFSQVISGIAYVVQMKGYYLQLVGTLPAKDRPFSQHYMQAIREKRVDGVIVLSEAIDESEILKLWKEKFPVLLVNRYIKGKKIPSVLIDNEKGLYETTNELIELGHREIVFMAGSFKYQLDQDKIKGYKKALLENNIKYDKSLIIEGGFKFDKSISSLEKLIKKRKKFTGIIASDDFMAMACIAALKKKNISVPRDISVIGFNDMLFLPATSPTLSSMKVPLVEMGKKAASILFKIINNEKLGKMSVIFEPHFVKRESIAGVKK